MKRPTAERVEMATVPPACTVLVSGVATLYFLAWQNWIMAGFAAVLFVVSMAVTTALVKWHEVLDNAERKAAFDRRMARIAFRPGRVTMQLLERD